MEQLFDLIVLRSNINIDCFYYPGLLLRKVIRGKQCNYSRFVELKGRTSRTGFRIFKFFQDILGRDNLRNEMFHFNTLGSIHIPEVAFHESYYTLI